MSALIDENGVRFFMRAFQEQVPNALLILRRTIRFWKIILNKFDTEFIQFGNMPLGRLSGKFQFVLTDIISPSQLSMKGDIQYSLDVHKQEGAPIVGVIFFPGQF